MHLSNDVQCSLRSAVELVNSVLVDEGTPDARYRPLRTIADLDDFLTRNTYTGRCDVDAAELHRMRDLRPQLRRLLTAERDEAVVAVNDILRRCRALPQLVRHDDTDWHVHAVDGDRPLDERILVETAMAVIDLIRDDEMSRLAACADGTCDALVVDLSRNRSKKYCSTACGNRNAVAAYRARQTR